MRKKLNYQDMQKIIIIITISFFCLKCYSQQIINDTSAKNVAISFTKWYITNRDSISRKINLVSDENGNPYRINFDEVKKYLFAIQKSNMVSDYFIQDLRKYFVRCDRNFIKHPQIFNVAFGFEDDLVMKYNDGSGVEGNIDKSKIKSYKKNKNIVQFVLEFTQWDRVSYELIKHKGKWLINKVNGDFPTEINHIQPVGPPK